VREAAVDGDVAWVQAGSSRLSLALSPSNSGSLGEPTLVGAGMIRPRAPRRVFSVISASWKT
jgi:hypothetical protein